MDHSFELLLEELRKDYVKEKDLRKRLHMLQLLYRMKHADHELLTIAAIHIGDFKSDLNQMAQAMYILAMMKHPDTSYCDSAL